MLTLPESPHQNTLDRGMTEGNGVEIAREISLEAQLLWRLTPTFGDQWF